MRTELCAPWLLVLVSCGDHHDASSRAGSGGSGEFAPTGNVDMGSSRGGEEVGGTAGTGGAGGTSFTDTGGSGGNGAATPLVDLGGGLVYDSVSDITWLGWGLTFSDDVKASLSTAGATIYDGPMIGATVEASIGPYTIVADDFKYMETMGQRWFGSWYAARAWVASFSYPWGSHQTITGWRLPTLDESNQLWLQTGGAYCGADGCSLSPGTVAPFTFILPKIWTATELTYADFTKYTPADSASIYSAYVATGFSNVWAVVDGRVTTQ